MADTISVLGIRVDSRQVVKAGTDLDKLAVKSGKAERATDKLGTSSKRASDGLRAEGAAATRTARATDQLAASNTRTARTTDTLTRSLRGLGAAMLAFIGLRSVRALKNLADEATNVQNRLKQVTNGTAELNARFADLVALSNRTRTGLSATSVLYQRLALSTKDLGLTTSDLLRLTETINKSFAVSGATATEMSGAIRQLSQGLAAGALRGDEFNSVAEQAPAIMDAIAKATGLARGELREFAATGGITAEILITALQNAEEEIDTRFAKSLATFDQNVEISSNKMLEWAAASDTLAAAVTLAGEAVVASTSGLTGFLDAVGLVAGIYRELLRLYGEFTGASRAIDAAVESTTSFFSGLVRVIGFVGNALITLLQIASTPFRFAFAAVSSLVQGTMNAFLNAAAAVAEFAGQVEKAAELRALVVEIKQMNVQAEESAAKFDAARDRVDALVDSLVTQKKATADVTDELTDAARAALKLAAVNKKLAAATKGVVAELKAELAELGRTDREQSLYNALKEAGVEANSEFGRTIKATNDELFNEVDRLAAAAQAAKDLAKATKQAAKDQARAYREAFRFTTDIMFDFFREGKDGWSDWADSLVDIVKDMLARMAAEFAASKILQFLGITGGAVGFSGAASASSGGGGASLTGVLSAGKAAFDFLSGGGFVAGVSGAISNGFQFVAGALNNAGFTGAAGAVVGAEANIAAAGGGNIALGSLLTVGAGILGSAAGTALGEALFGKEAQSAVGATIGAVAGSFLGPVGALVGGAIGGALDALFGSSKKTPQGIFQAGTPTVRRPTDRTIRGNDAAGITSSAFGDVTFSSTQDLFKNQQQVDQFFAGLDQLAAIEDALASTLSEETIGNIAAELEKVERQVTKKGTGLTEFFSNRFSVMFDEIGGTAGKLFDRLTAGLTDDEIVGQADTLLLGLAAINAATGDLATVYESVADLITTDTLVSWIQLSEQLVVANALLDATGAAMFTLDEAGTGAADALVKLFGGAELFVTDLAKFNEVFGEQQTVSEAMLLVLTDLNLTLPSTRDGFVDLVQSLDLTTQSGSEAFATLVKLPEAANNYYAELERLEAERQAGLRTATDTALSDLGAAVQGEKDTLRAAFDKDIAALQRRGSIRVDTSSQTSRISSLNTLLSTLDRMLLTAATRNVSIGDRAGARGEVRAAISDPAGADLKRAFAVLSAPSEGLFSSRTDFQRDTALTTNALQDLRDAAAVQKPIAERTLAAISISATNAQAGVSAAIAQRTAQFEEETAALDDVLTNAQQQVDLLRGINTGVLRLAFAMDAFAAALGAEATGTTAVPAFASGGTHSGGLRLVGESGPEIEATGPSRITSNADLADMLGSGDVVAELRTLREQVKAGNFAIARNTLQTKKVLERWDTDGTPNFRETQDVNVVP